MSGRLQEWLSRPTVVRSCQVVSGVIFAWAGLAKIGDLRGFAEQLHNFRLVPIPVENLLAMSLPWIELTAALALLLGIQARAGAMITAGLMAVFTAAVGLAMLRGLDIECGCFGTRDASRVGWVKLTQNAGIFLVAAVAALRRQPPE